MKKISIIFGSFLGIITIGLPTILTSCNSPKKESTEPPQNPDDKPDDKEYAFCLENQYVDAKWELKYVNNTNLKNLLEIIRYYSMDESVNSDTKQMILKVLETNNICQNITIMRVSSVDYHQYIPGGVGIAPGAYFEYGLWIESINGTLFKDNTNIKNVKVWIRNIDCVW